MQILVLALLFIISCGKIDNFENEVYEGYNVVKYKVYTSNECNQNPYSFFINEDENYTNYYIEDLDVNEWEYKILIPNDESFHAFLRVDQPEESCNNLQIELYVNNELVNSDETKEANDIATIEYYIIRI